MSCKFCELRNSPGTEPAGTVYVMRDAYPVTPGHWLIIPMKHRRDYFDLTEEELLDVHGAIHWLRDPELDYNIGWNCGEAAGQTIAHAHCHLIPRRPGDVADPAGGVRGVIPERQNYRNTK